jgi:hypothetical protein
MKIQRVSFHLASQLFYAIFCFQDTVGTHSVPVGSGLELNLGPAADRQVRFVYDESKKHTRISHTMTHGEGMDWIKKAKTTFQTLRACMRSSRMPCAG